MLFFSCIFAAFRSCAYAPAFQKKYTQMLLPVLGCPELRRQCPVMKINNCDLAWRVALGCIGTSDNKGVQHFVLHPPLKSLLQGYITELSFSRAAHTNSICYHLGLARRQTMKNLQHLEEQRKYSLFISLQHLRHK